MKVYDAARARIVLRELERSTSGHAPMLRLERQVRTVHGTADRLGLFRSGVRLALAALDARWRVTVDETRSVRQRDESPVIDLIITEDRPAHGWQRYLPPAPIIVIQIESLVFGFVMGVLVCLVWYAGGR